MRYSKLSTKLHDSKSRDIFLHDLNCAEKNPYSREHPENPILLTSSEYTDNYSLFLESYSKFSTLHSNCNHYGDTYGRNFLLDSLSHFLSQYSLKTSISPDSLICTCGSSAAFDLITSVLCDPQDAILIVSPCYFAFDRDFSLKSQTQLYYIDTHCSNFCITKEILDDCYTKVSQDHRIPKLIVFTNPSNPIGKVYSKEEMTILLDFAKLHDIHILSDEVYSLSVDETDPSNPPFVSYAKLVENDDKGKEHITIHWGLSKDFGLHGFRFSCLQTKNTELLGYMREFSYLYELPSPVQSIIANMLSDESFIQKTISLMHSALKEKRSSIFKFCENHNIPFVKTNSAFYIYANLQQYMKENTFDEESRLCHYLYTIGKIFISPGSYYHSTQPGWFRIVFTVNDMETTLLGMNRLCDALHQYK